MTWLNPAYFILSNITHSFLYNHFLKFHSYIQGLTKAHLPNAGRLWQWHTNWVFNRPQTRKPTLLHCMRSGSATPICWLLCSSLPRLWWLEAGLPTVTNDQETRAMDTPSHTARSFYHPVKNSFKTNNSTKKGQWPHMARQASSSSVYQQGPLILFSHSVHAGKSGTKI